MKRHPLGNYGLGWALLALFLGSWLMQTWTGWVEFRAEQQQNGHTAEIFGDGGYVWAWAQATFENWQSEFLQLLAMVALTSFLIFKGSAESRDGDDETRETLARLERRLDELVGREPVSAANGIPHRRDLGRLVSTGD